MFLANDSGRAKVLHDALENLSPPVDVPWGNANWTSVWETSGCVAPSWCRTAGWPFSRDWRAAKATIACSTTISFKPSTG